MTHVPDGVLRRLADEPLAVPDAYAEHLHRCRRCRARNGSVVEDRTAAQRLLARPHAAPDVDAAWERLATHTGAPASVPRRWRVMATHTGAPGSAPRRWRVMAAGSGVAGSGAAIAAGVVVVGAAAAATLTAVFSPTHVAPVPVTSSELQAIARVFGAASPVTGTGARTWAAGTITWGRRIRAVPTATLAAAASVSGVAARLPAVLPNGVGGAPRITARPASTVTVTFGPAAGQALDGSTLRITLGGAVLIGYGGAGTTIDGVSVPTLAILEMQHPTATSSGASLGQLESFVLSRPGFPSELAAEVRLLGNLSTVLPVPTSAGVRESSATVGGAPAMVLDGPSGVATAVVWEDPQGIVRAVGGLLDQQDVLGVARQVG